MSAFYNLHSTHFHKMNTIDNILKRRSIRRYKSEQIPADTLKEIINCGINAPSALNMQPWQIRVIRSKDMLQRLNGSFVDWARGKELPGSASRAGEEGFSVFHNAPTLLIVAADTSNHYAEGDCGMFTQNVLLAANSLGVGTCVIGSMAASINESPDIRRDLLHLTDKYKVLFGIAMGYADECPDTKQRESSKVEWI